MTNWKEELRKSSESRNREVRISGKVKELSKKRDRLKVRKAPRWLADMLDMWADTTVRRILADGSHPHSAGVILEPIQDTPDAGKEKGGQIDFTGRPIEKSARMEPRDRLAHKRQRTIVTYEANFDMSTIEKYRGAHVEKKLLGLVHGSYVHVERVLSEVFAYGQEDAVWIGRIALLMRYPERGPNAGISPRRWTDALSSQYPELWARLDRQKSQALNRLSSNIETVLKLRLPDAVDEEGEQIEFDEEDLKMERQRLLAIGRCRKAVGMKLVTYSEFMLYVASVHTLCVYFSESSEHFESNDLRTAS